MKATCYLACGLLLCVVSCLTGCDRSADDPVLASAENVAPLGTEEGDGSAPALKAELRKLNQRLHDLEYPELRKRDPREITFLQARVAAQKNIYEQLRAEMAIHGDSIDLPPAAYCLAVARAELAWAQQDVHEAVSQLVDAAVRAAEIHVIAEAYYKQGLAEGALDRLLEAQDLLAHAEIQVIRAEKVAAFAKVDISDIPTDPAKRVRKSLYPPSDESDEPIPARQPAPSPPDEPPDVTPPDLSPPDLKRPDITPADLQPADRMPSDLKAPDLEFPGFFPGDLTPAELKPPDLMPPDSAPPIPDGRPDTTPPPSPPKASTRITPSPARNTPPASTRRGTPDSP